MKILYVIVASFLATALYSAQNQPAMPTTNIATTAAAAGGNIARAGHTRCYPAIPDASDVKELNAYIRQHARLKSATSKNPYICTGCIQDWEDSVKSNSALRTLLGVFSTSHTERVTGLMAVNNAVRIMVQPEFLQQEERRIATTYTGATIPANDNNARLAQETPHFIEHMLQTSPHFCAYNKYNSSLNDWHFVLRQDHKIILCCPNCQRIATTRAAFEQQATAAKQLTAKAQSTHS